MHMFTRIYLCREDSAAVQRSVEVECPTRQVTQEYTLLVCIIVCPHVYTRPYLVCKSGIRAVRQERRHRARQAVLTGHVQRRLLVVTTLRRYAHANVSALPPPCPSSLQLITWSQ